MHELGTINYVIKIVEDICVKNTVEKVNSVTLQIGTVSGMIPSYLVDYWEWAKKKTTYLKEAKLNIEDIEAITYCEDCKTEYDTIKYAKVCPNCGSEHTYLIQGNEYMIKEIEAY